MSIEMHMQFLANLTVMAVTAFGFFLLRKKVPKKYEGRYFIAWLVSPLLAVQLYKEGISGTFEFVSVLLQAALFLLLLATLLVLLFFRR